MPPASPTRHIFLEKRNNESFKKDNLYSPSRVKNPSEKKRKGRKKFVSQEQKEIHPPGAGKNPPSRKQKESPYTRKEFLSRRTLSFLREQVRRKESLQYIQGRHSPRRMNSSFREGGGNPPLHIFLIHLIRVEVSH
jgi:hypothetical protein